MTNFERNLNKLMELQDMSLGYRDDVDSIENYKNYHTTADLIK